MISVGKNLLNGNLKIKFSEQEIGQSDFEKTLESDSESVRLFDAI